MISSSSLRGSSPVRLRIPKIWSKRLGSRNCTGEILTETGKGSFHFAASLQACSSTHSPIWMIEPLCSAMGMKTSGLIRPRSGCIQRRSAS
ncbi:hypothetical protein D3C72_2178900 [compost metagenome]